LLTTTDGTVYLVSPGDEKAKVIVKGVGFNHISASADGRFFVVDDFCNGRLYVGSIAMKRCLPLCDSRASCGRPQYTHTHPYITPDNRHVIFNSDQTGICQVYAAVIPDGFLDNLLAE
jgi:Tol biopolymer transport system component